MYTWPHSDADSQADTEDDLPQTQEFSTMSPEEPTTEDGLMDDALSTLSDDYTINLIGELLDALDARLLAVESLLAECAQRLQSQTEPGLTSSNPAS